jgi:6-pyruvoyltetrahydropterin/6-carboxytetrahydropterin synthase
MLTVTKVFKFCYGHWLPGYDGKCSNQHGHNAKLEVAVSGKVVKETSMIIDFVELKNIVKEAVIDRLDHTSINNLVGSCKDIDTFFSMGANPTAENMVIWIANILKRSLPVGLKLERVRLYETEDSYCEWKHD